MTMKDKQVGELWADWSPVEGHPAWDEASIVCDLIRKLVEERANKHYGPAWNGVDWKEAVAKAVRDFGIDPETWK